MICGELRLLDELVAMKNIAPPLDFDLDLEDEGEGPTTMGHENLSDRRTSLEVEGVGGAVAGSERI